MDDPRINLILEQITNMAQGNFEFTPPISDSHDELDGIILGLGMLSEELKNSTVSVEKYKEEKEKAEIANKAKSEFLANMSHEIRTPLNAVIGFTDLLMKTKLQDTQKQYMEIVFQSANSLLDLLNDILDFSKIEVGKLELNTEKILLNEIFEQATDIIKFKAHSKGLEVLLRISPDAPKFIWADHIRLKQILVNLLGNAVKFTEKGEIECAIEIKNPIIENEPCELVFSVRDTGIGVSQEFHEKIFHAFSQADASTTRRYGGTGLGLTISNQLLGLMNSKLELKSEEGEGSTFYFSLKVNAEQGEQIQWSGLDSIENILIVDDNYNNRLILQEILNSIGIKTELATNGLEALEKIEKNKNYDVVIMDYQMPYMDGLEVIRGIRNKIKLTAEEQPIILLHSSSDDEKINEACKKLNVQFKLIKPVKRKDLLFSLSKINKREIETKAPLVQELPKIEEIKSLEASLYNILIVDDNPINSFLAKVLIEQLLPNSKTIIAENGLVAVEKFKNENPDLIFMDVQMPILNGYEATNEIRKLQNGQKIPIIALTAGTVSGEKEKCLKAGMNDYASKPIVKETLEKILAVWLPKKETESEKYNTKELILEEHFNREELIERLGNKPEAVEEFLIMAIESLNSILIELKNIEDSKNSKLLFETTHRLTGITLTCSFPILNKLAKQLEEEKEFNEPKMKELMPKIKNEILNLFNLLKSNS